MDFSSVPITRVFHFRVLHQHREHVLGFFAFDGVVESIAFDGLTAGFANQE
jgi:hypothetical protein